MDAQKQSQAFPTHRDAGSPLVKALPSSLQQAEQELKSRPTYKRHYENAAEYQLVLVSPCHLITPQWYLDLNYVEALKAEAPRPGDLEGALAFCFKDEILPEPAMIQLNTPVGQNYILDFPRSSGLPWISACNIEPINLQDPASRDISISVHARGNYSQVAQIQETLLVVNGTHHIGALFTVGWDYVPVLLRSANSMYDCLSLQDPGLIYEAQKLARPPFLCDYFNEDVVSCFQQPCPNHGHQMIIQSQLVGR